MVLTPAKRNIARTFGLKASTYDANACFQAAIIARLLSEIGSVAPDNGRWIDLGCGTGLLLEHNRSEPRKMNMLQHYFGLDIAFEPLQFLKKKAGSCVSAIQGDIDHLPIKPGTFDVVIATSVLQWLADPAAVFSRISTILTREGYFAFSFFINGSFLELFKIRSSFGIPLQIHCPEPETVKKSVVNAGFDFIHDEIIEEKQYFPDAITLLKNISGMGGTATAGKKLTRRELGDFCRSFDDCWRGSKGVPLTYRALLGICRKRF